MKNIIPIVFAIGFLIMSWIALWSSMDADKNYKELSHYKALYEDVEYKAVWTRITGKSHPYQTVKDTSTTWGHYTWCLGDSLKESTASKLKAYDITWTVGDCRRHYFTKK